LHIILETEEENMIAVGSTAMQPSFKACSLADLPLTPYLYVGYQFAVMLFEWMYKVWVFKL
jgi:hypothetical protein